ncbi:putative membrane protein [gamma proteobacterium IMCC2047]|nr:putative membrane protein [gamma proteobacterium IMCC2047]
MIFAPDFFPLWLLLLTSTVGALGFLLALIKAPWQLIARHSERQHLVFGASILLGLFWIMRVEALEILTFHPLVMTAITLMLGWHFAMLAGAVAQLVLLVAGFDHWSMIGVNYLVTAMVPASLSFGIVQLCQRLPFKNLFVFLFGAGFLGAALCSAAVAVVTVSLLLLAGYDLSMKEIAREAPILLILMFPEGFINGTIVTALTVFKPHLMKTFNEDVYFGDSDKKG